MRRLLYVVFFLEVGFVLVVLPWLPYWDRNYFITNGSIVQDVLTNNFVRGGVSGLGLLNIAAGLVDLAAHLLHRPGARGTAIGPFDEG